MQASFQNSPLLLRKNFLSHCWTSLGITVRIVGYVGLSSRSRSRGRGRKQSQSHTFVPVEVKIKSRRRRQFNAMDMDPQASSTSTGRDKTDIHTKRKRGPNEEIEIADHPDGDIPNEERKRPYRKRLVGNSESSQLSKRDKNDILRPRDCLKGRGVHYRAGNADLLEFLEPHKESYRSLAGKRNLTTEFTSNLLQIWKANDRRFFAEVAPGLGLYYEISDKEARKTIRQKLTEKTPRKLEKTPRKLEKTPRKLGGHYNPMRDFEKLEERIRSKDRCLQEIAPLGRMVSYWFRYHTMTNLGGDYSKEAELYFSFCGTVNNLEDRGPLGKILFGIMAEDSWNEWSEDLKYRTRMWLNPKCNDPPSLSVPPSGIPPVELSDDDASTLFEKDFLVLDGAWLCQHLEFPRMQEACAKGALVRRSQVDRCYFISHRWEHIDFPDPYCVHAVTVAENIWDDVVVRGAKVGVWYDYTCLPQKPRTGNQEAMFQIMLHRISEIQEQCDTRVVCRFIEMPTQLCRGWCLLEMMSPWSLWPIKLDQCHRALYQSLKAFPKGTLAVKLCSIAQHLGPEFFGTTWIPNSQYSVEEKDIQDTMSRVCFRVTTNISKILTSEGARAVLERHAFICTNGRDVDTVFELMVPKLQTRNWLEFLTSKTEELRKLELTRERSREEKRKREKHIDDSIPKGKSTLFVKTLTGKTLTLEHLDLRHSKVCHVKFKIRQKGHTSDVFRLLYAGKQLDDEQELALYGLQEESTLHLVDGLMGGLPKD